ncbi:hypothetical protein RNA01_19620 [Ciceribacter naphthalenivorans]|uniref:Uncharacterized protein n=2 Tax=Alphaproteobacteria TaxID=28211 RepID=A0A512HI20_9HYPH|nr:hypothetical protein RNA01_19620 [Ciceribacter naphthalenivorans]
MARVAEIPVEQERQHGRMALDTGAVISIFANEAADEAQLHMDLGVVVRMMLNDSGDQRIKLPVKQSDKLIVTSPYRLLKLQILQRNRLEQR